MLQLLHGPSRHLSGAMSRGYDALVNRCTGGSSQIGRCAAEGRRRVRSCHAAMRSVKLQNPACRSRIAAHGIPAVLTASLARCRRAPRHPRLLVIPYCQLAARTAGMTARYHRPSSTVHAPCSQPRRVLVRPHCCSRSKSASVRRGSMMAVTEIPLGWLFMHLVAPRDCFFNCVGPGPGRHRGSHLGRV